MQHVATAGARWIVAAIVAATGSIQGHGAACGVPSTAYPTIQSAVDDPACTEVELAIRTFRESPVIARDLVLSGDSSTTSIIEGHLEIRAGSVRLADLRVDASVAGVAGTRLEALWVHDGALVDASDVVVVHAMGDVIFFDGFEGATTARWSGEMP